jgi:hypothetical protein
MGPLFAVVDADLLNKVEFRIATVKEPAVLMDVTVIGRQVSPHDADGKVDVLEDFSCACDSVEGYSCQGYARGRETHGGKARTSR